MGPNGRPHEHYVLTATGAAVLNRPVPERVKDAAVPHGLAVVDFGTALLGAAQARGWAMMWDGEFRLALGGELADGVRPDSRIRLSGPGVDVTAWVEVDRGTETWTWLGGKLERLAAVGGADVVLLCCTTPGRAAEAVRRVRADRSTAVAVTTLPEHTDDPLAPIWTLVGGGERLALPDLARVAPERRE